MRRALGLVLALAALAGCGLGPGESSSDTRLTVTEDFGARRVAALERPDVQGADTVMRLLQRNARVTTRFGGGFVQSIDGLSGGHRAGGPVDWFYYVNGVEAGKGAAATKLNDGDRVWWDRHDWSVTPDVKAVVGSFPEPFLHGIGGRKLPVRIECADPGGRVCDRVARQLTDRGIPASRGILQGARSPETLRILVGTWNQLRQDEAAAQLERGPKASGVYATPSADGRSVVALDAQGRAVRRYGAATGLVAATRLRDDQPVWVVTGTDAAGLDQAIQGFDEGTLEHRFALMVSDSLPVSLPAVGRP
jgi:Domain of unknown function (DUF4430)